MPGVGESPISAIVRAYHRPNPNRRHGGPSPAVLSNDHSTGPNAGNATLDPNAIADAYLALHRQDKFGVQRSMFGLTRKHSDIALQIPKRLIDVSKLAAEVNTPQRVSS
jgi:hypothetical protein